MEKQNTWKENGVKVETTELLLLYFFWSPGINFLFLQVKFAKLTL